MYVCDSGSRRMQTQERGKEHRKGCSDKLAEMARRARRRGMAEGGGGGNNGAERESENDV